MNTEIKNKTCRLLGLISLVLPIGLAQLTQAQQPALEGQAGSVQPPNPGDLDKLFGGSSANAKGAANNAAPASSGSPLSESEGLSAAENISVDFPNEEIRTVLRNVADLYMLNIVIPETLQGTTSIKLRDVSWRQIFKVVLDPVGFTYVEDGNIINVISKETLNFEPPVTDIFMLNYAEASKISGSVANLVDAKTGGRVQVDERTNGLIVTERQSKMAGIREVINRLDKPTEQVLIEARFIEVTNQDIKNIGVNWASLKDYSLTASNMQRSYDDSFGRTGSSNGSNESNALTNRGSTNFDVGGAKLSGDAGTRNGTLIDNLTGTTLLDATSVSDTYVADNAIKNLTSLVDNTGIGRLTRATFTPKDFSIVLSALKEQDDSRLVSNPTVVTLNNQEAVISVGEQFPVPNYTYNEERGTFEISGFEYKDIGVILKVKPSVNSQGLITLRVVPEVSSKKGQTTFGGASGAEIPIISTRRTETQIALQDGYTMGLGGLMENRDLNGGSQVPVLGKIPGLGRLFRHESKTTTQLNLLVFITARILPGEKADFEDVFTKKRMNDLGIDPESIRNQ